MHKILNLLFIMRWFSKKNKEDDFLDLTKDPLSFNPINSTSISQPDNTTAKLDLINTRLQNIDAKLERIEFLLNKQIESKPSSPVKW